MLTDTKVYEPQIRALLGSTPLVLPHTYLEVLMRVAVGVLAGMAAEAIWGHLGIFISSVDVFTIENGQSLPLALVRCLRSRVSTIGASACICIPGLLKFCSSPTPLPQGCFS